MMVMMMIVVVVSVVCVCVCEDQRSILGVVPLKPRRVSHWHLGFVTSDFLSLPPHTCTHYACFFM